MIAEEAEAQSRCAPSVETFDYASFGRRHIEPKVTTFVVGLGAQKCGTTWLHRALSGHKSVLRAPAKELHFWDQFRDKPNQQRVAKERARFEAANARFGKFEAIPVLRFLTRRELQTRRLRVGFYEGTFEERLASYLAFLQFDRRRQTHLMDITPAYSRLGADQMRAIATLHPDVRFVFLMRDPVERCWSGVHHSMHVVDMSDDDRLAACEAELRQELAAGTGRHLKRSRYDLTLEAIREAGIRDQTLPVFYESLFQPDTVDRIGEFLGLPMLRAQSDKRVNAAARGKTRLSPALRSELREALAPAYAAVETQMGRLPEKWQA